MKVFRPTRIRQALCAALCTAVLFASIAALARELAVVAGQNSTVSSLDQAQVRNIFLGRAFSLPDGSAVVPVDQPESSALREEFYLKVAACSADEAKARWAELAFTGRGEPPRVAHDSADIKRIVNATPGAVGYIEASELDDTVKILLTVQ